MWGDEEVNGMVSATEVAEWYKYLVPRLQASSHHATVLPDTQHQLPVETTVESCIVLGVLVLQYKYKDL